VEYFDYTSPRKDGILSSIPQGELKASWTILTTTMSYSAQYKPEGIEYHHITSFKFHNGDTRDVRVAYRVFNKDKLEKVALVPTCYGGIINQTLNFSGNALKDYKVIVVAMLGNGESTSPSMDENFPKKLFYQDCVNSQYDMLTKGLGIKQLDVVVRLSPRYLLQLASY
jgi:homoserine acetyltransferase